MFSCIFSLAWHSKFCRFAEAADLARCFRSFGSSGSPRGSSRAAVYFVARWLSRYPSGLRRGHAFVHVLASACLRFAGRLAAILLVRVLVGSACFGQAIRFAAVLCRRFRMLAASAAAWLSVLSIQLDSTYPTVFPLPLGRIFAALFSLSPRLPRLACSAGCLPIRGAEFSSRYYSSRWVQRRRGFLVPPLVLAGMRLVF